MKIHPQSSRTARMTPAIVLLMASCAPSAMACATCFGETDSPMAQGMNAGIAVLLVAVGMLWLAFGSFFVFIVKRSKDMGETLPGDQADPHHN